jgi:catechol 2,3-dioxygenase-like lactoylglutathione lyase family enzyme
MIKRRCEMSDVTQERQLDAIHHVAIAVEDIRQAIHFYSTHFRCKVDYQDETWALLDFSNIKLALVIRREHEPHIAFTSREASKFGELRVHRDGTRSVYIKDPSGNTIEIMDIE